MTTTKFPPRHADILARLSGIESELTKLGTHDDLTRSQEVRFADLRAEFETLDIERGQIERSADLENIRAIANGADGSIVSGTPGFSGNTDAWSARASQLEERARRVIDAAHGAGTLSDLAAARAEQLATTGPSGERSIVQEWMSVTGRPEYFSAFVKLAHDPVRGHMLWSDQEREAFTASGRVQALLAGKLNPFGEARAMSLTDNAGGYLVPFQLDPSVILTSNGATSSIHAVAREVVATSDVWYGISSAGVTGSWDDEAEEVSDDSPTLVQPSIPIHMARIFVPISIEAFEDAANVATEVGKLIADEAMVMESTAFTTGTGTGEPTGIITALAGGSSVVSPVTPETFASADVYATQNALPARFQANATWQAALGLINAMRQQESAAGARLFPELADARLLGRAIGENSVMDSTINAAATADNYVLLYGDFSHYVVARRIGLTVELIPHLFHTSNNRPSGQRGWFAHFRVGADSVADQAFRVLNVATTA